MERWELSGQTCPRCGNETEELSGDDGEGHETIDAERCTTCRWIVDFNTDDELQVEDY